MTPSGSGSTRVEFWREDATIRMGGVVLRLQRDDAAVLSVLARHPGVCSRADIAAEIVTGQRSRGGSELVARLESGDHTVVSDAIRSLRRAFERAGIPVMITTTRAIGFALDGVITLVPGEG
jgi:DNA-binding response OmpR family regulator